MNLSALVRKTGARLVRLDVTEHGDQFVIPGGAAAFSLVAEFAPGRALTATNQPAPIGGGASAAVVLYGDAGGTLVPLAFACVSDLSPSPLHLLTCGGMGFESYRIGVASPTQDLRLSCRPVAYGGPPTLLVDPRARSVPSSLGVIVGAPAMGAYLPVLDGSRATGLVSVAPFAVPFAPALPASITGGAFVAAGRVVLEHDPANAAGQIALWGSGVTLANAPLVLEAPGDVAELEIDDAGKVYAIGSVAGLVLRVGVKL